MIPSVVASESGTAQTEGTCFFGVAGARYGELNPSITIWKNRPKTVTVGCAKDEGSAREFPSNAVHVKLRMNLSGPPDKAKYSLATDSELVP